MYFKPAEFDCKCGACNMGYSDMDVQFVQKLDLARSIAKTAFVITSGFRCFDHNRRVGGIEESAHLTGNAADIACTRSHERFLIVSALLKVGFDRILIYDTFIHVDNDKTKPTKVLWIDD